MDEEFERGLREAWEIVNALIKHGPLDEPAHSERNGLILAANTILANLPEHANQKDLPTWQEMRGILRPYGGGGRDTQ